MRGKCLAISLDLWLCVDGASSLVVLPSSSLAHPKLAFFFPSQMVRFISHSRSAIAWFLYCSASFCSYLRPLVSSRCVTSIFRSSARNLILGLLPTRFSLFCHTPSLLNSLATLSSFLFPLTPLSSFLSFRAPASSRSSALSPLSPLLSLLSLLFCFSPRPCLLPSPLWN